MKVLRMPNTSDEFVNFKQKRYIVRHISTHDLNKLTGFLSSPVWDWVFLKCDTSRTFENTFFFPMYAQINEFLSIFVLTLIYECVDMFNRFVCNLNIKTKMSSWWICFVLLILFEYYIIISFLLVQTLRCYKTEFLYNNIRIIFLNNSNNLICIYIFTKICYMPNMCTYRNSIRYNKSF